MKKSDIPEINPNKYGAKDFASQSEWISIEDRLPPFHTEILFYVNDKLAIMKGAFYRNSHKFKFYGKYTEAAFYKDEVTHWMPLPKPPTQ